jgi:hypothetical protein
MLICGGLFYSETQILGKFGGALQMGYEIIDAGDR